MMLNDCAILILAAGKGKRMISKRAKVLHKLNNKSLISYVINTALQITKNCIVVVGHQSEEVKKEILNVEKNIDFALQREQLGTGHATLCAMPLIKDNIKSIIILYGDVPLLSVGSINELIDFHNKKNNTVTILSMKIENPTGYGRLIIENDSVIEIVEESDASVIQKDIKIVNSGVYMVKKDFLNESLEYIDNKNTQNEFYLTDIIKIAGLKKEKVGHINIKNANELKGINDKNQLMELEQLLKNKVL